MKHKHLKGDILLYTVIGGGLLSAAAEGEDHSIGYKHGKVYPERRVGYQILSFVSPREVTGTPKDTVDADAHKKYNYKDSPCTQAGIKSRGRDQIYACPIILCRYLVLAFKGSVRARKIRH